MVPLVSTHSHMCVVTSLFHVLLLIYVVVLRGVFKTTCFCFVCFLFGGGILQDYLEGDFEGVICTAPFWFGLRTLQSPRSWEKSAWWPVAKPPVENCVAVNWIGCLSCPKPTFWPILTQRQSSTALLQPTCFHTIQIYPHCLRGLVCQGKPALDARGGCGCVVAVVNTSRGCG